jgi:hypothetical protein
MTIRSYSSPEAFKQALEQRLRTSAKSGAEFARKRQLRIQRARTTKDVDLRMVGAPDDILARLQEAGPSTRSVCARLSRRRSRSARRTRSPR